MQELGIIKFVGGLQQPESARSIQVQTNGKIDINAGLYLKSAEHLDGFWVIETSCLDEALSWGHKAGIACRAPVEVRPFY